MAYVFATDTASLPTPDGLGSVLIAEGDVWDADDPIVKKNGKFFSSDAPNVNRSVPVVEQASAAPGERRSVRRPAKKSTAKG